MNNNQAAVKQEAAPKKRKRINFKDLEKAPFITEALAVMLLSVLLFTGENDKIATEILYSVILMASSLLLFVQYIWNKHRIATVLFAGGFTAYTFLYTNLYKEEFGVYAYVYIAAGLSLVALTALHAVPFLAKRPYWLWVANYIPAALLVITGYMNFLGFISVSTVFAFKVYIEAVAIFFICRSLQYPVRIPENKASRKLEIERFGKILSIASLVLTIILVAVAVIVLKSLAKTVLG